MAILALERLLDITKYETSAWCLFLNVYICSTTVWKLENMFYFQKLLVVACCKPGRTRLRHKFLSRQYCFY